MKDTVANQTHLEVQQYYGETLSSSDDLKTNACCTTAGMPEFARRFLDDIHAEVSQKYYGCGLVLPELLEGLSILDLGCGSGRDVYLLSALTGSAGRVVGVDMTEAQLDVARAYRNYHAEVFGHPASNVEFIQGNIENLGATGLAAESFDLIVSNCVINLAVDKQAVLDNAYRLLRNGGEMYFADIYVDRRIPDELRRDPVLYGECLAGAMYPADFMLLAQRAGFTSPRLVEESAIEIHDKEVASRTGKMRFTSATYRLFKAHDLEASEEDYGQQVTYLGTIAEHPAEVQLDVQNRFPAGAAMRVSRNTAAIIQQSRFAAHFELKADASEHLGTFGGNLSNYPEFASVERAKASGCC
jgi:ubiquinone/menaquinone biosynthesis C-methylase UbiE